MLSSLIKTGYLSSAATTYFNRIETTGASTGPSIGGFLVYSGSMEISPDRNTLYYADYGLSPGTIYKFDVSGPTPVLVYETPFDAVGENGQDLELSHDGTFLSYATGGGQNGTQIAKFRTSDFATLGSFNTGAYPRQMLLVRTTRWVVRCTRWRPN